MPSVPKDSHGALTAFCRGAPGLLFVVAALSCGGTAASSHRARSEVEAVRLTPPVGASLPQACTPSGPELCFNAVDDNCNGVIDEGCGEETGLLQFTIAWDKSAVDVNLSVITPGQERIPAKGSDATAPGFQFGGDCPGANGCGGQNVENIYFDAIEPPRGHYVVEIALGELHGEKEPVKVHFGARLGSKTLGFDVTFTPAEADKKTFAFDLR